MGLWAIRVEPEQQKNIAFEGPIWSRTHTKFRLAIKNLRSGARQREELAPVSYARARYVPAQVSELVS